MKEIIQEILKDNGIEGELNSIFKDKNKEIYYIVIDKNEFLNNIYKLNFNTKEISESGINLLDLIENYKKIL